MSILFTTVRVTLKSKPYEHISAARSLVNELFYSVENFVTRVCIVITD